jgi:hypothetical protein
MRDRGVTVPVAVGALGHGVVPVTVVPVVMAVGVLVFLLAVRVFVVV